MFHIYGSIGVFMFAMSMAFLNNPDIDHEKPLIIAGLLLSMCWIFTTMDMLSDRIRTKGLRSFVHDVFFIAMIAGILLMVQYITTGGFEGSLDNSKTVAIIILLAILMGLKLSKWIVLRYLSKHPEKCGLIRRVFDDKEGDTHE